MQKDFTGIHWFNRAVSQLSPLLAYSPEADFSDYRSTVREKLRQLLGDMPNSDTVRVEVEGEEERPGYTLVSFVVETEDDRLPCKLVLPPGASAAAPAPVVICLQGHETGMSLSLGTPVNERDRVLLGDHMDFALQALENGFASLLVEMRFMGERRFLPQPGQEVISCYRPTMAALLLGKTTLGLRVADLRAGITALEALAGQYFLDTSRLICLGHSGAGTTAYFTTCLDERIKGVVVSGALCNFQYSILHTEHCSCNYVPALGKYLNMSDMAAAVFPRPIISSGGTKDDIFLMEGVEKTLNAIDTMYTQQGAPGQCVLCKGEGGHAFFPHLVWPEIMKMYASLQGG